MMTFEEGLQAQLLDPKFRNGTAGKRVSRILKAPPAKKAKALARMEQHASVHLGIDPTKAVDWSAKSIDWSAIMALLVQLLPLILAMFGI